MSERMAQLQCWLEQDCGLSGFSFEPASEDASFRRYFRLTFADGESRVVMDAPPEKEDCRPFLQIGQRLRAAGLHAPRVYAQDLDQGFMLLEDLGVRSYLDALTAQTADDLYADALAALLRIQSKVSTAGLPAYDRELLMREMALFRDWLLKTHLGLARNADTGRMLDEVFGELARAALDQPVVCVHRDYHSRNLMVVPSANPGIIDFQDAVCGPVTYDLVSLLRDCYVSWPADEVDRRVLGFHAEATRMGILRDVDAGRFLAWFDLMGVQRHLKAAGIFARLNHRDGKPGYLADIPRTLAYIVAVGRRRAVVSPLADFVAQAVLPRVADQPIEGNAGGVTPA
jgi:aminoglycoside/choline kinase family phosphotransferase